MQKEQTVGIYCRLSDEDRNKIGDEDSRSIQNQKSLLIDYATKQGWNIYNIYSDDDYSGADQSRPEWNRLLKDCENKKINIVLCKSQSRFSRELEVIEKYIHGKFIEWGTRFVSIVDYADTDIESNKKSRQINGLINEWYLEDTSKNVRKILQYKAQNGEYVGAFACYGYAKDPNDKHHLIIDPVAAQVVRRIFKDYTNGLGVVKISQQLNKENIAPPSIYKRINGLNFYNVMCDFSETRQVWTASTLTRMIVNEMYIGNMVQGRHKNLSYKIHKKVSVDPENWIIVKNTHEPIIDMQTWEIAQQIRKSRQRCGKTTGTPSPLNRKIFCARCGATMRREHSTCNGVQYKYLTCATRRVTKNCNNTAFVKLEDVEQYVIQEINKLLDDYYSEQLIQIYNNKKPSRQNNIQTEILTQSSLLESKKNKAYKLYNDKIENIISETQFIDFNNRLNNEIKQIEIQLNNLKSSYEAITKKSNADKEKQTLLQKYKHITKLDEVIVHEFIDKITIDILNDGAISIIIYWNF